MSNYKLSNLRTVGGELNVQPLYRTWTDVGVVADIDKALLVGTSSLIWDKNFMVEFADNFDVPVYPGLPHPIYKDCCCTSVQIIPMETDQNRPSSCTVKIIPTWFQARNDSNGVRCREVRIASYEQTEIRNYDVKGKQTKVSYQLNSTLSEAETNLFPTGRITDVRCPRVFWAIKVIQYENISTFQMGDMVIGATTIPSLDGGSVLFQMPFINSKPWAGFPANVLMFTGTVTEENGFPIAKREYNFLYNDRGWKYLSVYTQANGYVPKDVAELPVDINDPAKKASDYTPINGIGIFDMHPFIDFNDSFPQIGTSNFGDV